MEMRINKFAELSNRILVTPATIFGQNGAGKTSCYNAFLWCLTGKKKDGSEAGKSVYSVKDKGDKRIADVEVKINDKRFQRICRPTYMRKKGTDEQTLKALCATTYILDGVEVTKVEYDNAVSDLCGGRDFQLFTDINYFVNLKKDKQLEIFMELLNVNRGDFFGDIPEIGELKKRLKEIDEEKKKRISFKTISEENLREMPNFEDFTEKILEIKGKIDDLSNNRPTLTDLQIAENNEISRKIAELQNYQYKTISSEKRRNLNAKRDAFNDELNNRNNIVRRKIEQERELEDAKNDLKNWENKCEMPSTFPEIEAIKGKMLKYEQKKQADETLLNNYEEANKEASCGLCPHCTDIFCEYRKTDLPTQDDLMRNITQYQNDIAGMWERIHEIEEDWAKARGEEYAEITKRISDLESTMPNVAEADEWLNRAKEAVILAEKEADEETASNEAIARENEQKRTENERMISELKAKIHIAQVAKADNEIYMLKVKLADFEAKQRDFDQNNGAKITLSNNIADNDEKIENLIYQRIEVEKDIIRYEESDKRYRNAIQQKASEMMPKGMSINLFRPLITGDGYEQVFEITYDDKEYKNTALEIWGNYQLTDILQKGFGVHLPVFVDDVANIVNEDLLPKGDDVILLVAVKDCDLEIVPNSELRGII